MKSAARGTVRTAKCRTLTDNCKIRASAQQHEPGRCISGLNEMSFVRCRAVEQSNGLQSTPAVVRNVFGLPGVTDSLPLQVEPPWSMRRDTTQSTEWKPRR